jgi:hypothetical protein
MRRLDVERHEAHTLKQDNYDKDEHLKQVYAYFGCTY